MWKLAGLFVFGAWLGDWLQNWKGIAALVVIALVAEWLICRLGDRDGR